MNSQSQLSDISLANVLSGQVEEQYPGLGQSILNAVQDYLQSHLQKINELGPAARNLDKMFLRRLVGLELTLLLQSVQALLFTVP